MFGACRGGTAHGMRCPLDGNGVRYCPGSVTTENAARSYCVPNVAEYGSTWGYDDRIQACIPDSDPTDGIGRFPRASLLPLLRSGYAVALVDNPSLWPYVNAAYRAWPAPRS